MPKVTTILTLAALLLCFGSALSAQALFRAVNPERGSFFASSDERPRAWRLHDLVMVSIDHRVIANRRDTFESEREFEIEATLDNYLRLGRNLTTENGNPLETNLESTLTSDAEAARRRTSTLATTIMAEVVQVMPGYDPVRNRGRLKIRAFKEIQFGDDVERVELTGDIEAAHIAADDTISYDRIFGSTLRTFGDGDISDGARPGWLSRIISNVWPF